jgi:hypothetical protein
MGLLDRKQCRQLVRVLSAVCLCCVFLTGAEVASQSNERGDSRENFVKLDAEIQGIKEEVLEINREILLLEELSLYPHGQQLIVLVSVAHDSPVSPDSLSLELDGQTVIQHRYTVSESAALQQGGVHRLYTGRLRNGEHLLGVSVSGRKARDQVFQQQHSATITKTPGRKYVELHLGPGKNSSVPGLTIREW